MKVKPGAQDETPRILIVDDEEKICLNCVKILSRMDCTVEFALNGYDALKRLEIEPFDVVITDLENEQPGWNGSSAARQGGAPRNRRHRHHRLLNRVFGR